MIKIYGIMEIENIESDEKNNVDIRHAAIYVQGGAVWTLR